MLFERRQKLTLGEYSLGAARTAIMRAGLVRRATVYLHSLTLRSSSSGVA
ncbi:MAG: hypothetical protein ACLQIB_17185 [Isosphaeraceae bacterium]